MTDIAVTSGMTIGPAISGFLRETLGYAIMNWIFGRLYHSVLQVCVNIGRIHLCYPRHSSVLLFRI